MLGTVAALFCFAAFPQVTVSAGGGACRTKTMYVNHNPEDSKKAVVGMTRSCFTPTILRVEPGSQVSFQNNDPYQHAIHGANNLWLGGDPIVGGASVRKTFEEPGTYLYSCYRHPGMTGAIIVGDDDAMELTNLTLVKGQAGRKSEVQEESGTQSFPAIPAVWILFASLIAFGLGRLSSKRT